MKKEKYTRNYRKTNIGLVSRLNRTETTKPLNFFDFYRFLKHYD